MKLVKLKNTHHIHTWYAFKKQTYYQIKEQVKKQVWDQMDIDIGNLTFWPVKELHISKGINLPACHHIFKQIFNQVFLLFYKSK
jgi:hypothetical protein